MTFQQENPLQASESQRTQYLSERYLEHSSLEELDRRFKDILRNMLTFSSAGIPAYDFSSSVSWLIERAAHVEFELELRLATSTAIALASPEIFSPEYPKVKEAIRTWGERTLPTSIRPCYGIRHACFKTIINMAEYPFAVKAFACIGK